MLDKLNTYLIENNFYGLVRIEKDSKEIFSKAYGYRDFNNKIKNDLHTKFAIASGTKFFTAIGVMKLVEENKIALDDSIFDYIKRPFNYKDVTIRQVLSHTSGLADYYDEDIVDESMPFKVAIPWFELEKPSDYYPIMPNLESKFPPGEKFNYNNSGYILLAILIESISGDYYHYLQENILAPLGLVNTGFYPFNNLPSNTAIGYQTVNQTLISNIYQLPIRGGGDGGIYTTGEDLHKLWQGFMSYQLLTKALTEDMKKAQVNTEGIYGLGLWLDDGYKLLGSDVGVSFKSTYNQDSHMIITVISNTSDGVWQVFKTIKKTADNQL